MLTMRTYIEEKLPIFDFAATQYDDWEYGQKEELKARIYKSYLYASTLNPKP